MEDIWFKAFEKNMNPVFTKEDFEKYKKAAKNSLHFYNKYLKKGAKILELGCGLGYTSVPLSTFGLNITGIDNGRKVVQAARKNAVKFGKNLVIKYGDVFKINEIFTQDSFDACLSGGLLEHFNKKQIEELIRKQLLIAPLVFASMPVKSKATLKAYGIKEKETEGHTDSQGIYRNFWDKSTWINDILKDFNIVEYFVEKAAPSLGGFEEIMIVIKR
ncbi:MAG: class I SAM-dependent methyltransferase [archaeon]